MISPSQFLLCVIGIWISIDMNPKEILLQEIFQKMGDTFSEQTLSETVHQFIRYGNLFLLFEVMNLRKEIKQIKATQ